MTQPANRRRLIPTRDARRLIDDPSATADIVGSASARLQRWLVRTYPDLANCLVVLATRVRSEPALTIVWCDGVRAPELMTTLERHWIAEPVSIIPLRHWSDAVRTEMATRLASWIGIPRILSAADDERAACVSIEWGALPIGGKLVRDWYYLVLEGEVAVRDCPQLKVRELRAMLRSTVQEWSDYAGERLTALKAVGR